MSSVLEKQLKSHTFFIDRSLGKKTIPDALISKGLNVEIHDDHFEPDTSDQEWLKSVGKNEWIVITKDNRIKNRSWEFDMVRKYNVRMFVVRQASLTGQEIADILINTAKKLAIFLKYNNPPFIASISKSGNISKIR